MLEDVKEFDLASADHTENEMFENEVIQDDHELYFLHHYLSEFEQE